MENPQPIIESTPAVVGPYRVLCELGRGAMAVVYLARSRGPGGFERLCALKMIHLHLSEQPEFVNLFLNEARIAALVQHPNVIGVQDIDLHEGRYYLRMDYVSGETLAQALSRTWNEGKTFPIDVAAQIIAMACDGLHAAHELKDTTGAPLAIVHRDVGPHNIIIGYDGVARVMDFGIAKAMDTLSGTRPGQLRGTVAFMSPEHVRGEPLDRRSDLFSLGVLLWETTLGARLFRHKTLPGTMARILSMEVPRPSAMRADYPAALERIVLRALDRDRDRRHQTARELGDQLRGFLLERGVAPSTAPVEGFMRELFSTRHEQRAAMEREASRVDVSGRINTALAIERAAEIMRDLDVRELTFEDEAAQEPTEVTRSESVDQVRASAAPPPIKPKTDPKRAVTSEPKTVELRSISASRRAPSERGGKPPVMTDRAFRGATAALMIFAVASILFMLAIGLHRADDAPPPAPLMVTISFVIEPQNAVIKIDGKALDGDLVVPLSPQQYRVEASAEGYLPKIMIVSAEASRDIKVELSPVPRKKWDKRRVRRSRN